MARHSVLAHCIKEKTPRQPPDGRFDYRPVFSGAETFFVGGEGCLLAGEPGVDFGPIDKPPPLATSQPVPRFVRIQNGSGYVAAGGKVADASGRRTR
jgi:hypothetical protein